jgi:YVTN family beta-propeller protein
VKIFFPLKALALLFAFAAHAQTVPPIFILNSLDATISVIDPVSWKETKRIPTGKEPHHLYMTPDQKSLIVANALSDSLLFVDPKTAEIQRTGARHCRSLPVALFAGHEVVVTAANRLNHVDIYRWDGRDLVLVKRIPTGKTPSPFVD